MWSINDHLMLTNIEVTSKRQVTKIPHYCTNARSLLSPNPLISCKLKSFRFLLCMCAALGELRED